MTRPASVDSGEVPAGGKPPESSDYMEQIRKRVSDGTFAQKERERRRRKVHMDQMRALRNQEVRIYIRTVRMCIIVLCMCTVLVLYLVCWYSMQCAGICTYIHTYIHVYVPTCVHANGINRTRAKETTEQKE